jgi:hypothetical protein
MTGSEQLLQLGTRRIFIDALNVAYWCGNPPSLRMPIALMSHLLTGGHQALLYFDASARYKLTDEADVYARLMLHPEYFVEVPSGRTADGVMLRHATSSGGCVVSRDKYRDHRMRYRKLIDDPARLMSGAVMDDRLFVPSLELDVLLPSSVHEAWEQLEFLLSCQAKESSAET